MKTRWNISQVQYIYKRDNGRCIYCGDFATAIDHVLPLSKGGKTIVENGVCACWHCNSKKCAKLDYNMITRGLFWLLQKGENIEWVDKELEIPGYNQ